MVPLPWVSEGGIGMVKSSVGAIMVVVVVMMSGCMV